MAAIGTRRKKTTSSMGRSPGSLIPVISDSSNHQWPEAIA